MSDGAAGRRSQLRAAESRGLSLEEYLAQQVQEEFERGERRQIREQKRGELHGQAERFAAQRRRMLYPGGGQVLPGGMTLLGSFVDSLYVAVQATVPDGDLVMLRGLQQVAADRDKPQPTGWTWRGQPVRIHAKGQLFWRLRLEAEDWNLLLDAEHGPDVYLQFRARYLYEVGPQQAWKDWRYWFVFSCVDQLSAKVSRIDLAADVAGLDLSELEVNHFVGNPRRRERLAGVEEEATGRLIFYGPKTFTIYLGSRSGKLHGRLYDKLAELRVSGKEWLLHYWAGWDGEAGVSRVECQVRLEFLQEMELLAVEDVLGALGDIWREVFGATTRPTERDPRRVVCGWCTYREPAGADTNRSRWPVATWWEALARDAFLIERQGLVSGARPKQQLAEARALAPAAAGYMAAIAYREGYRPEQLDPHEVAQVLPAITSRIIEEVMDDKGVDWGKVYADKLVRFGKRK